MVKYLIFFLSSFPLWGKPAIIVSYYDAFSGKPTNNSEIVAHLIAKTINEGNYPFRVSLCGLSTAFDTSFQQLTRCAAEASEVIMILGLGEGNCNLKIETMVRNLDRTLGPDNAGNERFGSVIVPNAPKVLGLTYPLEHMYCALDSKDRQKLQVSNSAGSFVCNNTAFQFAYSHPQLPSGFIHVPDHACPKLDERNEKAVRRLVRMLVRAQEVLGQGISLRSLPLTAQEIKARRLEASGDKCLSEFFGKTAPSDKTAFWNILFTN